MVHSNGSHPQVTTQQERLVNLRRAVLKCLADAAHEMAQPLAEAEVHDDPNDCIDAETLEDRAMSVEDQMWSNLLYTLIDYHTTTSPTGDPDAELLDFMVTAVNWRRHTQGKPFLRAGVPVVGSIVADEDLGNRVIWNQS